MSIQAEKQSTDKPAPDVWPGYKSVLLAVDSSDHSNRATEDAIVIADAYNSKVTATHVYAAKMHDMRFKQMEGGLPEQFREEDELERQRNVHDVHDDLITRGLSIITSSYLTQAENLCLQKQISFQGRSLEGKNYREMTQEANNGDYDLLVMGSLGLGAIQNSRIGTVTERVTRRSLVDTLIIKQPNHPLNEGPIVCAIDGSSRSFGGLRTAIELAKLWQAPLHVISAFDPHYHYVAFNRIAGVLSEEDAKVFRFKEQEELHEEIIDDGLAKIYQGHLDVAETIAAEQNINISSKLLDGKPHDAIERYLSEIKPSLLVIGKLGIHADDELDIGGNAENLLRNTECAILFSMREYTPRLDVVAETTTSWTHQAEERMQTIPPFVQGMARMAILRYAQQQGHTVITASIVDEATSNLCPAGMKDKSTKVEKQAFSNMQWSTGAAALLNSVNDETLRDNTRRRAEKKAKLSSSKTVEKEHVLPFVVTPEIKQQQQSKSKCPFAQMGKSQQANNIELPWTDAALKRLNKIPVGTSREMTKKAADTIGAQQGLKQITDDFLESLLGIFSKSSDKVTQTMPWDKDALAGINKAPPMVQGMLIKEIEGHAQRKQLDCIDLSTVEQVKSQWNMGNSFHLDPKDPRNNGI
ncbi:MAG: universal stress protein [Gammaproteobacteria bacterium]|nr:universal stress protein [Gammaproteobacteria bacterium]